jgi:hypothetical protein
LGLYWIDADVLIQASQRHYTMKRVPKFWSFMSEQLKQGTIKSTKIVYDEWLSLEDELSKWCRNRKGDGLAIKPSQTVQERYGEVASYVAANWKTHQMLEFLKGGDGWIIAHAIAGRGVVVSQESEKRKNAKVKIPTVCKALNVECIDTFKMLDRLNARF